MRIETNRGPIVELHILGYQFPHLQTKPYDSNWLIIEGRITHPRGSWRFRNPCLLTYEAARLGEWLAGIAAGTETEPQMNFVEPNLSFEQTSTGASKILRVGFALESRPPWLTYHEVMSIDFPVAELHLAQSAAEWNSELAQYPQRAAR